MQLELFHIKNGIEVYKKKAFCDILRRNCRSPFFFSIVTNLET